MFALHTRDVSRLFEPQASVFRSKSARAWPLIVGFALSWPSPGCSSSDADASVGAAADGGHEGAAQSGQTGSAAGAAASSASDGSADEPAAGDAGASGGVSGAGGRASLVSFDADGDAGVERQDAADAVSVTELSQQLAAAVCESLRSCLGEQKLNAFVDGEVCETRFTKTFAQTDFANLDDAVQRGRVELHADLLEQCYADTSELGCAIQTERLPSSCQRAIQGTRAPGETCTSGLDCMSDGYCPATACSRVCTVRARAAGSCSRDEECQTGLICVSGECAAPAALGEPCSGHSKAVCALGASCVGSTPEQAGRCAANADVQVGAAGEACTPGGTLCREGLSCAYDGDTGFNCQEPVASGASCHLALPTQCPRSEYCTAPDVTTEGRCSPLPGDGEACVLGSECAGGHVCLADGDSVICTRLRDLGEACTQAAMCRSGRCSQDHCAAPEVCD